MFGRRIIKEWIYIYSHTVNLNLLFAVCLCTDRCVCGRVNECLSVFEWYMVLDSWLNQNWVPSPVNVLTRPKIEDVSSRWITNKKCTQRSNTSQSCFQLIKQLRHHTDGLPSLLLIFGMWNSWEWVDCGISCTIYNGAWVCTPSGGLNVSKPQARTWS